MEFFLTRSKTTSIENIGHGHCLPLAFLQASNSLLNPNPEGGSRVSAERMIYDCGYIMNTLKNRLNVKDVVTGLTPIQAAGFNLSVDANDRLSRWTPKNYGLYITDYRTTRATIPPLLEVTEELLNIYAQIHVNLKLLLFHEVNIILLLLTLLLIIIYFSIIARFLQMIVN